jgi:hypothetical protein
MVNTTKKEIEMPICGDGAELPINPTKSPAEEFRSHVHVPIVWPPVKWPSTQKWPELDSEVKDRLASLSDAPPVATSDEDESIPRVKIPWITRIRQALIGSDW